MKKLISIFVLVMTVLFISPIMTSCHDDPDDDDDKLDTNDSKQNIVGTWICYDDAYGYPWDEPFIISFKSDGSGWRGFSGTEYDLFNYSKTGSQVTIKTIEDDRWDLDYKITKNGTSMVLQGFDDDDMETLKFTKIEEDDDKNVSIVGKWKSLGASGGYNIWTFTKEGEYSFQSYWDGEPIDDYASGTYRVRDNKYIDYHTDVWEGGDEDSYTDIILLLTSDFLITHEEDDDIISLYKKV